MKAILIFLFVSQVFGCINEKSKKNFFGKNPVCNGLYREKFSVFSGGAWSAELYSDYLTDSVNFRIYIGTHDEREGISYECNGDAIIATKFTFKEGSNTSTILSEWRFSLSKLIREHKFD